MACPTLYIRGKRDRIVHAGAVDVIRAALPSIVVEELDAPHLVLRRNPSESARLISRFIAQSR